MPALLARGMMLAVAIAGGSALLGGALALAARSRPRLLERTRTFAFAAAASVVGFHLLPDVLPQLGARALVWVALGFGLPWALEAVARALGARLGAADEGHTGLRVAAEVGYAALLFHSLVEGLTLWAAIQQPGALDLEIAIVAHHAPLTAAVALPLLELLGPRATAIRVGIIALAGAGGVLAGGALPQMASLESLILPATAATAGALLHVAFDEIGDQRFASGAERASDLAACAAGVGVAMLGALYHSGGDGTSGTRAFSGALAALALHAAPALLGGAIAAELLRRRPPAGTLARLLSALPIDAAALTLLFFGWTGLAIRLAAAAVFAHFSTSERPPPEGAVDDACRRGPWILLALLLAAAIHALASPWALQPVHLALVAAGGVLLASALIPEGAASTAATLVAAVLSLKGAPAPLVFAALAAGSAVDRSSLRAPRGALLLVLLAPAVAAAAVLAGVKVHAPPAVLLPLGGAAVQLGRGGWIASLALLAWLALQLLAAFRKGVRGFLSPLRHGAGHEHHVEAAG